MPDNPGKYFVRFSHGFFSSLELACVCDLGLIDFQVIQSDQTGAIISCDRESALRLIRRLGSSYKVAKIFADSTIEGALSELEPPYADKFGWTISGYNSTVSEIEEAKEGLRDLLKEKNLRRTKFIDPLEEMKQDSDSVDEGEEGRIQFSEVRVSDLLSRVFSVDPGERPKRSALPLEGIDLVVHGGIGNSGPFYGNTIGISDIFGFEKRDFDRPYQDPTVTVGPRIARAMVNMAAFKSSGTALDPFCGLGTILQEALVLGYSVIGIDKNSDMVTKAKTNLRWAVEEFSVGQDKFNVIRQDARRIDELTLPRIDFIASEPILLPTFKRNPSPTEAGGLLGASYEIYESTFENLASLLSSPDSRIALTTPTIIDSHGRPHTSPIIAIAKKAGLAEFWPKSLRNRTTYPIRIETSKKKIVCRDLSLFCLKSS